jgi:hypothetical protein
MNSMSIFSSLINMYNSRKQQREVNVYSCLFDDPGIFSFITLKVWIHAYREHCFTHAVCNE